MKNTLQAMRLTMWQIYRVKTSSKVRWSGSRLLWEIVQLWENVEIYCKTNPIWYRLFEITKEDFNLYVEKKIYYLWK